MDNSLEELEAELKRLRPVAPAPELAARVQEALRPAPRRAWAWLALPLAAAVALALLTREQATPTAPTEPLPALARTVPPATASYKPISAQNVLYDQRDEGLVTLADGSTARRIRNSYVDTITWKNTRTQASLRWSVPRTEERVIPVTFQ